MHGSPPSVYEHLCLPLKLLIMAAPGGAAPALSTTDNAANLSLAKMILKPDQAQLPKDIVRGSTTPSCRSFYDLGCRVASTAINSNKLSQSTKMQMCEIAYEIFLLSGQTTPTKQDFKNKILEYLGEPSAGAATVADTPEIKTMRSTITAVSKTKNSLSKIAGITEAKAAMKRAVEIPLRLGSLLRANNINPPQGVLLYGPPGTGKTIVVKAIAAETEATLMSPTTAQVMSSEIGGSDKLVAAIFTVAMQQAPSIIFMDEFDAIANPNIKGNPVMPGIRQQFLVNMLDDAFTSSDCAFIAASNYPNNIDAAIRSRLGSKVYLGVPSEVGPGLASVDKNEALSTYKQVIKLNLGSRAPPDLDGCAEIAFQKNLSGRDIKEVASNVKTEMLEEWSDPTVTYVWYGESSSQKDKLINKDLPEDQVPSNLTKTSPTAEVSAADLMDLPLTEIAKIYMPPVSEQSLKEMLQKQPGMTQAQLDAFKLGTEGGAGGGKTSTSSAVSFATSMSADSAAIALRIA